MMLSAKIDFRILEWIKRGVNKEYEDSTLFIPLPIFRKYWRNLIKPEFSDLDPTIEEKIAKFITTTPDEQVDKNRLFTLIDFYQYYPVYVQRDRNMSQEMQHIMNPNNEKFNYYGEMEKNLKPDNSSAGESKSAQHVSRKGSLGNQTLNKREALDSKRIELTTYKPLVKTTKRMVFGDLKDYHGLPTLPSDNMSKIVNHQFEKDYILNRTKRERDHLIKVLLKEENVRGQDTKASIMRNKAIKSRLDAVDAKPDRFILKQFEDIKPSNYISETTKDLKKSTPAKSKKSNFDTASVLRIAELNQKALSHKSQSEVRSTTKEWFVGEEVEKLKEDGAQIHTFDIESKPYQNSISTKFGLHNSKFNKLKSNRNPYGLLNKSVDNKNAGSRRGNASIAKTKKGHNLNKSMLPSIKDSHGSSNKHDWARQRKDEGEYARMLANHNNNRLVIAQKTIEDHMKLLKLK